MRRLVAALWLAGCAALPGAAPETLASPGDVGALPSRGICAHRGASHTHPENTLAALREAVRLGAHMVEFDVALTADGHPVLMHDAWVDRTTNGSGPIRSLRLSEVRKLDAGSWKDPRFAGEGVPTLDEALAILPTNMWINVQLKEDDAALALEVAHSITRGGRLEQAFIAGTNAHAVAARRAQPGILFANLDRRWNPRRYAAETISMRADFIQLKRRWNVNPLHARELRKKGVRINYCCAHDAASIEWLYSAGVEFPLVNRVEAMVQAARVLGIPPLEPQFRDGSEPRRGRPARAR